MTSSIQLGNPSFNSPEQQVFRANEGLEALSAKYLSMDFIQEALQKSLVFSLDPVIEQWNDRKRLFYQNVPYAEAATLMLLLEAEQGVEMLLTRRAAHLKKHSGQISFPGGRIDKEDASAKEAAIRETFEEVGIIPSHIQVMGQLPDFFTGTGFLMKPFVAKLNPDYTLNVNKDEVDEVFSVPLSFLLNPDNHFLHHVSLRGHESAQGSISHEATSSNTVQTFSTMTQHLSKNISNGLVNAMGAKTLSSETVSSCDRVGQEGAINQEKMLSTYFSIPWKNYFIWGATAAVIRSFYHLLLAARP